MEDHVKRMMLRNEPPTKDYDYEGKNYIVEM